MLGGRRLGIGALLLEGLLRLRDLLAPCLRQLQDEDLDRRRQRHRGERAEDAEGAEERDGDDDEEAREVDRLPLAGTSVYAYLFLSVPSCSTRASVLRTPSRRSSSSRWAPAS